MIVLQFGSFSLYQAGATRAKKDQGPAKVKAVSNSKSIRENGGSIKKRSDIKVVKCSPALPW